MATELSGQQGDPKAWRNPNKPVGDNWSRHVASWSIPDGCATMPASERWQYIFMTPTNSRRLEKIFNRAARLIWSVTESPLIERVFQSTRPREAVIFLHSGY